MNLRLYLIGISCLISTLLLGCATVKEAGKGFIGVSTKVLEQKRPDALKKSFALGYDDCYAKVKDVLKSKGKESYIYAENPKQKLIAVYFYIPNTALTDTTLTDTTPVGIFFTEESAASTLIEISSPSIYAKEEIANRIFAGIDELIKPKKMEKKIDVKKESDN